MKVKIIELYKLNNNNRIYPKEVFEKALKEYKEKVVNEKRAIVYKSLEPDLSNSYGIVDDIYMENDSAYANISPLMNIFDNNVITKMIDDGQLHVVTCGVGTITNNIIQDDYILNYLYLTDNPSYSLIKTEL